METKREQKQREIAEKIERQREYWKPRNVVLDERAWPELGILAYLWDSPTNKPDKINYHLVAFTGRRVKPNLNYCFRSTEEREKRLAEFVESETDWRKWREEQKVKNKGVSSSHAAAAKAIRGELKEAFPEVTFRVVSDSFTGGTSINVYWTDGPLTKDVERLTNKYEYGHFDGMTDIYEYSNVRNDIPQVKYLHCARTMSEETKQKLTRKLEESYGVDFNDSKQIFDKFHCWPDQVLRQEFNKVL